MNKTPRPLGLLSVHCLLSLMSILVWQPAFSGPRSHSWEEDSLSLKKARPDSKGLMRATQLLDHGALVIRFQAIHWILAFTQLRAGKIPAETQLKILSQLQDQRNFSASGEALWVPPVALKLLRLWAPQADQRNKRLWNQKLQGLLKKAKNSSWKAQLESLSKDLVNKP